MFYEVILQHTPEIETKDGGVKNGKPVKEKFFIGGVYSTIEAETVATRQFALGTQDNRVVSVKELPGYRDVFIVEQPIKHSPVESEDPE